MIGGLWNGFSGLNAFNKALTAESNNSTNTNTVGYKSTDVRFEDLMYKSSGAGTGSEVGYVFKRFHQGDIKPTGHNLDVAIQGNGYFIVNEPITNDRFYTRAGNFQMDAEGFLQTPDGLKVQGLNSFNPQRITTNPELQIFSDEHTKFIASETIRINQIVIVNDEERIQPLKVQSINARVSDYTKSAQDGGISGEGFKSASTKIIDIEALITDYRDKLDLYKSSLGPDSSPSLNQITSLDYRSYLPELQNENDFLTVTINHFEVKQQFDTDTETTMRLLADKITKIQGIEARIGDNIGQIIVESIVPAKEVAIYDAAVNNKNALINNIQNQQLGVGYGIVESSRNALQAALVDADADFLEITNEINLLVKDVNNVADIPMKLSLHNLSEQTFGTVEIVGDEIFLRDGDNKFLISKLQTAFFRNDQGLLAQGDNLYKDTLEAGEAQYANDVNTLYGGSLEVSNTSNSESMTNFVTYQKAFEANAKSITTADELLRTAINLRK